MFEQSEQNFKKDLNPETLPTQNSKAVGMQEVGQEIANPAPLGLLGFGITTVLLNFLHNAQLARIDSVILGMGIFYGGLAQIIAGIMDFKKGNTFGATAFTSYGLFWWSFVFINLMPLADGFFSGAFLFSAQSEAYMAYFLMWGIFTLSMFFGTLKKNRALQFVFLSLALLFFLLAVKSALLAYTPLTSFDLELFTRVTGVEGIVCGLSAVYLAIAEVLNESLGRTVLPICPVKS